MKRKDRSVRTWFGVVLALAMLSVGCTAPMLTVAYLLGGDLTPAEFKDLKGKKVVVVCRPRVQLPVGGRDAAQKIAKCVGQILKKEVSKIQVVKHGEVADWMDNNSFDEYVEVGRALESDYVISIDLIEFSTQEGQTLLQGVITDYDSWYPPRLGLQTQWYAANPGFHPIPPGYGLPWGTPDEQDIPGPVVLEAEMALAKAQLDTQVPACGDQTHKPIEPPAALAEEIAAGKAEMAAAGLPEDWPDARGFIPAPPQQKTPTCWTSNQAIIEHTANYIGNDMEFTEALQSYYYFLDEARHGGWQSYLNRSDDFIRFCCYMHIAETLSTRGGVGETRAVWRWENPK